MQTQVKDYLVPTQLETVLYGVLTVIIIFIANINYVSIKLLHTGTVSQAKPGIFDVYTKAFLQFIEGLAFVPSGAVFIFWSIIGIVLFSLAQSIYNVYAEVKNNIRIANHFLHPRNYISWQFWVEVIVQTIAHLSLYSLMLLWGVLMAYVLVPISGLFARRLFESIDFANTMAFISSLVLLYVSVMISALILKLFFKRKQLMI